MLITKMLVTANKQKVKSKNQKPQVKYSNVTPGITPVGFLH